jgi:proton-translocating NADH-quinone oxidoreductase chain L
MVQYAWLIPALPLAALIIVLLVTRPLDLAARPRVPRPAPPDGDTHGTGDAHDIATAADHDAHAADAGEHDGGHGEHDGTTPFWAQVSSIIAVAAMMGAFIISAIIFIQFLGGQQAVNLHLYNWFSFGSGPSALNYVIEFRVDTLTAIMLVVVTGVSMLVHLYSIGYMAGDPGYSRFFMELSLFTVSMLILVLGANFLVLFIGWELVGLSSYLLIGFWFDQAPPADPSDPDTPPYPPPAALKAFITTRFGDFGFLIGILILFFATRTFDFVQLQTATKSMNIALLTLAMILVFAGAVGKSAQFPLHVWLPDAMAGPTPVSALIHAATMVAAGVYLVARLFPIYAGVAGPQALEVVGYIGGFTALFAATIALTQNDIKKVLAYSTISQLGYMFVGLGVADTNATGMFHLVTHAAFKALLFLGSGCVILAAHHVQNMRKMGGMARFMPITALTMLLATLSISGIPPFAGFWSKDPIIAAAFDYGTAHGGNYWLYGMVAFTAFLTAFYMFRLYFMTFGGRGGGFAGFWGGAEYRGEGVPHEAPWTMWLPLVILAVPTVILGFWSINSGFADYLTGEHVPYTNPFTETLTYTGIAIAVVGIALAWLMYGIEVLPKTLFTGNPVGAFIYRVLFHKYYLDELYGAIIKYVVLVLAKGCALFDQYIIDGLVDGIGRSITGLGSVFKRSETGLVQNYGAAMFGGVIVILVIVFFAVGALK